MRSGPQATDSSCCSTPPATGRVVEVLGDLEAADHAAYFVPGVGNDIDTFDSGTRAYGERVQAAVGAQSPAARTATIAWLGYDAPEGAVTAATVDRAAAAADPLPAFVDGVTVKTGDRHVTVIGHSYGAVATSLAAQDGLVADDIVLIGSPGARAETAGDLGGANVWAARTADDWIRFAPGISIGGLGHGTDPMDEDFGARPFETGDARGHSGYLGERSLSALHRAAIVAGDDDEVVWE